MGHFTVVCSVTWPLNGSVAGGDLAFKQTSLLLSCKLVSIRTLNYIYETKEVRRVSVTERSSPTSLLFKGQVTEQTTVKIMAYCFPVQLILHCFTYVIVFSG